MLTEEMAAVVPLIDRIAAKLRGPDHVRRLAILRAQLLTLAHEAEQSAAYGMPPTNMMGAARRQVFRSSGYHEPAAATSAVTSLVVDENRL